MQIKLQLLLNNGAVFGERLLAIIELLPIYCCRAKDESENERRVVAIVTGSTVDTKEDS